MVTKSQLTHFQGSLGVYEHILTDDGTQTLFSHFFDESCHSSAGAYEETIFNYVLGTNVAERIKEYQEDFRIFEVGFGTGLGFSATIDHLLEQNIELKQFIFVSSELDEGLAHFSLTKLVKEDYLHKFERIVEDGYISFRGHHSQGAILEVLIGDIRVTLPLWAKSGQKVQSIYQDAFSPLKNPTLWTTEWFRDLLGVSAKDCILSTYCSSKAVWKSMLEAGWKVNEVMGFGKKRYSTRAQLSGSSGPQLLKWCEESPIEALRDPCDS